MKKIICIVFIIGSCMLLLPLSVLGRVTSKTENEALLTVSPTKVKNTKQENFKVYNHKTDKIVQMKAEDYIFSVVAAEMPALYHEEALKAQAVAAYTYALYKKELNSNKEYDISTDFTVDQSFITVDEAKQKWGEKAEEYIKKIKLAVSDTLGEIICVDNKPILAVYHAVSCGQTYDAENVWGKEIPYLKSVSSEGDLLEENYITTVIFTLDELKKYFSEYYEEDAEIISDLKSYDSGLVKTVNICGKTVTGSQLRSILELPSSNFTYKIQDDSYIFTVKGRGHGTGMSQNGANYLAQNDYDYKEILKHYYTNCDIVKK